MNQGQHRLVDYDNGVGVLLHDVQYRQIAELIQAGKVVGIDGERIDWEEALDVSRDICVDEDAYDTIKLALSL